jgi:hypothetical protein
VSDQDRKTPIPRGVQKSHSNRIAVLEEISKNLEEGQGKLAGDIGNLDKRVRVLEGGDERDSDRPSQAQFSLSPTGARAKFRNISAWVIVTMVVIFALMFTLIALIVRFAGK